MHPEARTAWDNLLLACGFCNPEKGTRDIDRSTDIDHLWPDRDNTFRAFVYGEGGVVNPAKLTDDLRNRAIRTRNLVGLNPPHLLSPTDARRRRWRLRRDAWDRIEIGARRPPRERHPGHAPTDSRAREVTRLLVHVDDRVRRRHGDARCAPWPASQHRAWLLRCDRQSSAPQRRRAVADGPPPTSRFTSQRGFGTLRARRHGKEAHRGRTPIEAINKAAAREKSIRHGHPSTLHLWWARRPLAAARAVLFAQLVDDPSTWPELQGDEAAQKRERERLFAMIEDMVPWEATQEEGTIREVRREIARSHARFRRGTPKADRMLADDVSPAEVNAYLATELPPVHDPFAGGGTIPLEAQRLGLRAIASDLNPVAVLINKALIEIPPKFAGMPPVNPESRRSASMKTWKGAQGLAEDVRYYGKWMRDEAFKRIGHLYPKVQLPKEHGGGEATVIAWLWARTVKCPNPSCGAIMPLARSFVLSTKKGKEHWVEPVVDRKTKATRFEVWAGVGGDKAKGTVERQGRSLCGVW